MSRGFPCINAQLNEDFFACQMGQVGAYSLKVTIIGFGYSHRRIPDFFTILCVVLPNPECDAICTVCTIDETNLRLKEGGGGHADALVVLSATRGLRT